MSRIAVLVACGLLLVGCWEAETPGAFPRDEKGTAVVNDDQVAGLAEIASMMREGEAYGGIVADLEYKVETPTALRFKSIIEKAARDELEFQRELAELGVDQMLSPSQLATFPGRQKSITSIDGLGKLYNEHVFKGSERTLEAVQYFVTLGAALDFDPAVVLKSDIDHLWGFLNAMVQAYGEIVVICNQGGAILEDGGLVFLDAPSVGKYEQAVISARSAESEFQNAYRAVLGARQRMIDNAMNAAVAAHTKTEDPTGQADL